ncbi:MAG TPA: hypothetical protein VL651_01125 [Bacteroidia bacterium]|jgi:hypothetical protein|nr:hypothetical protein [Bacteroidia bacterium]
MNNFFRRVFTIALALVAIHSVVTGQISNGGNGLNFFHGNLNSNYISLKGMHCDTVSSFHLNDDWPAGIAWDGHYLWGGGHSRYIYKYSSTGTILDSIPNPNSSEGTSGLVFDGNVLWVMIEEADQIFKLDARTGAVLREFDEDLATNGFGLALEGDYLLVTNYTAGTIDKLDKTSGKVVSSINLSDPVLGIVMINNTLFGINDGFDTFYEINTSSGKFTDSLSWCIPYPLGMTWDGTSLWNVSSDNNYGGVERAYRMNLHFPSSNSSVVLPVPVTIDIKIDSAYTRVMIDSQHTLSGCAYTVKSSSGSTMLTGQLTDGSVVLDISKFPIGTYFFQVGEMSRYFEIKRK